ncbi:uncharacterized protein DNG_10228 [Cephalotrichum gorgonifer]|uniref:P450 domain-containing protein n=1 Tax=Cephalotrichum gorgonifer TaxID=2041049 RepID=A0AAE8N8I6_9PEZI|nr:uncharacterized protein DNG_10228 [Cephalotrichum gorgonifer]
MLDDILASALANPQAFLPVAFTTTLVFALYRRWKASRSLRVPFLKFEDGDDSRQRYLQESGKLLKLGYEKAFAMRNYIDELAPQVYLPLKYMDEFKAAHESQLSFPYFSELLFSQNEIGMAKVTEEASHVMRTDLIRNLPTIIAGVKDECSAIFNKMIPLTPDWTPVTPYPIFAFAVARLSARVIAGPELSKNDEWLGICLSFTKKSMEAAHALRASWPAYTRWAARYFSPAVKTVLADRKRATELLTPVLEARRQASRIPVEKRQTRYNDGVQWLMETYDAQNRKITPAVLAEHQLFLAVASIHSSSAITLSILYDLLDEKHQDAKKAILDEIEAVRNEYSNWTRPAVAKLLKLDSFMKESQRLHFMGHARVTRAARVPYTFKDGLHLPKGTMAQVLHSGPQTDPQFYEDPETFDPWRFLRKRETIDPYKFQFASLSNVETTFGAGFHACPARNYAADTLKLVLVHLLTSYDIKYQKESQTRPPDTNHDNATLPDFGTVLLFKGKSSQAP